MFASWPSRSRLVSIAIAVWLCRGFELSSAPSVLKWCSLIQK